MKRRLRPLQVEHRLHFAVGGDLGDVRPPAVVAKPGDPGADREDLGGARLPRS